MWYLLDKGTTPPLSLHRGKAQALKAAHLLLCERGNVIELGPVRKNKNGSILVGLEDVDRLWLELHVRRVGIAAATLIAAVIGAGLLVFIPGDQIGGFTERLFSRGAVVRGSCDLC